MKKRKLIAVLSILFSSLWKQSIIVYAVRNDDDHPSLNSHFFTHDLNASPPPPSDDGKPASENAPQVQKKQAPNPQSRHAMLKVSHLTPKQEERRKRERERAARNWRNLSVEERKRKASKKNAKQTQKYKNLPEELKEIQRAKMRSKGNKRRKKDPAKIAAYQRRYRKLNPEKAHSWQRNRTEKKKALEQKLNEEASKGEES